MALLILGYAGPNVSISSGRASSPHGFVGTGEIARHIFVDGALTDDRDVLQKAARQMLIQILSCREDRGCYCALDFCLYAVFHRPAVLLDG